MKTELKLRKLAQKEPLLEDRTVIMDITRLNPVDDAYYAERKEAIKLKKLGHHHQLSNVSPLSEIR